MEQFEVTIVETLKKTVKIEAEDQAHAEELAEAQWNNSEIILDASDFVGADFQAEIPTIEAVIQGVLVEPMQAAKPIQLPDTLKALQDAVGGYIEVVTPFDDPVVIVCNEEGLVQNLPMNRALYTKNGEVSNVICGSFLVLGSGEEDFESLSPELLEKYQKHFAQPERFYNLAGRILAQKVQPLQNTHKKAAPPER